MDIWHLERRENECMLKNARLLSFIPTNSAEILGFILKFGNFGYDLFTSQIKAEQESRRCYDYGKNGF